MPLQINRIIPYSKDVDEAVRFYQMHFGSRAIAKMAIG